MDVGETTSGPAGSLLRSVIRLAGGLLEAVETRVDLFATELREDGERSLRMLAWALAALLTAILGALMAGVTLIIVFWDTHRVAVAVGVTAAFLVAAVACAAAFRRHLREKPRLLDATRSELQKDVAAIRSHQ